MVNSNHYGYIDSCAIPNNSKYLLSVDILMPQLNVKCQHPTCTRVSYGFKFGNPIIDELVVFDII